MENTMTIHRRTVLRGVAGALALPAVSRSAWAETYPARPVRWVVGFAAGGPQDIVARLLAQSFSQSLGRQFIVENRAGAGGNIGTEAVVRSAPDGHTILMVGPSATINVTLYEKLNFSLLRDLAPVGGIMRTSNVLEVNPSVPVHSVAEFIDYAKAHHGKINMASAGTGTSQHVAGELFKMMTGVDLVHVPYRGAGPALTDLLGGQVQVMFDNMASSVGHVRNGQLRGLAVTTMERSKALPELPTVADTVPGYEASGLYGISVPRQTPSEVIDKLNATLNATVTNPGIAARLVDLGGTVMGGAPQAYGKLLAMEVEKWAKVVKFSGAKAG
jgi:tripartite-type tricarboxylate transporter receptor subunit TctC